LTKVVKKNGNEKKKEFQLTKKRTIYLPKKKGKKIFFFNLNITHINNLLQARYLQYKQIIYTFY